MLLQHLPMWHVVALTAERADHLNRAHIIKVYVQGSLESLAMQSCQSQAAARPSSTQWSPHIRSRALGARTYHTIPSLSATSDHGAASDATSLKSELMQRVSKLNSSLAPPSAQDTAALIRVVRSLSQLNPTPVPEESALINGRWVLLYTSNAPGAATASNPEQQALLEALSPFQALSGALYKVFYTYLPILAGSATGKRGAISLPSQAASPVVRSRGNFQTFDLASGTVMNEARFDLFGSAAAITVLGSAEVVSSRQDSRTASRPRLKAMFTSFSFTVNGQTRLSLPLAVPNLFQGGALQGPVGYVDTCYLDEELRISSGDKGSLFITVREGKLGSEQQ